MSTYRLDRLLSPRSVAVIGASPRERSVGRAILKNLRDGGFAGEVHVVNTHYPEIDGNRTVARLQDLAVPPDLAVIAAPAQAVPDIVRDAAQHGVGAAVVVTAGLGHGPGSLASACEQAARAKGLRLLGPNCLGLMVPHAKLNAGFAARMPPAGDLALISQSGAIAAGMVDWAAGRSAGFSAVVSIGDQLDIDFGDLLDYFALDLRTRAILLYIESIKDARKFMSAARAAARVKPVIVIKAGRHTEAARAAATHTGALAGADDVYDAAFRRAGLLRVLDLGELFNAAETLGRLRGPLGGRLAIVTNGGGIGVLAIDRLIDLGGTPAAISEATIERLDPLLPPTWSRSNPVDIIGDADAGRYAKALDALLDDPAVDAVLVMNVETALAPAAEIAKAVAEIACAQRQRWVRPKPILATWVGNAAKVGEIFDQADVPSYPTETDAIRGFMHLVRHGNVVRTLMQTPPSLPSDFSPDVATARKLVAQVIADGRLWMDPVEATKLLQCYAIPTVPVVAASDPDAAAEAAVPFLSAGGAVVVKIHSRDIIHKSDVNGVRLNLTSVAAVRDAAQAMIADARKALPAARISGVTVQPMIVRPRARELIAGIADDPTFGPVIVFGRGGVAVEVINDKALSLPPLDLNLARELVERTRVSRLLGAYRNVPAVKHDQVALTLVKLAQLAADLPHVRDLDINPLLADETGVLALDARIAVTPAITKRAGPGHPRFAVRPYPSEWERHMAIEGVGDILVRPVRPEDEVLYPNFFRQVSADDMRLRFFAPVKDLGHAFIARLTQLDYARAMAFAAISKESGDLIGVVRLHSDANYETSEYAILLRSDMKGHGLGWKLMELIIEYARAEGLRRVDGQVLAENLAMLKMCRELGFTVAAGRSDRDVVNVSLALC
ncbi:MAG: bifunctional acetate--CoA ligase family protein/GNAT family N-acetyltransferase [Xanthobacteraceae bacterium]|nr:bifunctional acetate--CoA ligase family protein/GNAT family N-acetyltransferase [Xanthobacteraceae bacterium]